MFISNLSRVPPMVLFVVVAVLAAAALAFWLVAAPSKAKAQTEVTVEYTAEVIFVRDTGGLLGGVAVGIPSLVPTATMRILRTLS